jgi:DNA-binding Lrp family transcriptional regulator
VTVFAQVRLRSQAEADCGPSRVGRGLAVVREMPHVNGEVDFILKCTAPDLKAFQRFLRSR